MRTLEPKWSVYDFQAMVEKQYTPICESHREENILCCVIALYNIFMEVIVGNVFIKCFINQQPNTHC